MPYYVEDSLPLPFLVLCIIYCCELLYSKYFSFGLSDCFSLFFEGLGLLKCIEQR